MQPINAIAEILIDDSEPIESLIIYFLGLSNFLSMINHGNFNS